MEFIKWMDKNPMWLKLVLSLPVLDIAWAVYRILKGIDKKNTLLLVIGILWIIPGSVICWLADLICVIIYKQPKLLK